MKSGTELSTSIYLRWIFYFCLTLLQTSTMAVTSPLIVIIRSPCPLHCFSTSIWAVVALRIALILLPPRPITLLIALRGTDTFLCRNVVFKYFLTTSFQPSSRLPACCLLGIFTPGGKKIVLLICCSSNLENLEILNANWHWLMSSSTSSFQQNRDTTKKKKKYPPFD